MADLGIFDIVALSKAGYKKKDIDAIIAGEKDKPLEPQGEADPTPDPIPSKDPEPQPQGAEVAADQKSAGTDKQSGPLRRRGCSL